MPLAVLGLAAIAAPIVAAVTPSNVFVEKTRCNQRDTEGVCIESVTQKVEYALIPADAQPVEPRLDVVGTPTYDSDGEIYFVTIREPKITMLDWFVTRKEPAARFLSRVDKYGNQTEEQLLQSGQRQMTGAKDRATYVALKAAGFDVSRQERGGDRRLRAVPQGQRRGHQVSRRGTGGQGAEAR